MQVVYCDNCGLKIDGDALSSGAAAYGDDGRICCAKCAPLFKFTTTALQKVQLSSKTIQPDDPTGEFAPVKEPVSAASSVTRFYFCETCGKRITDKQILEGLGHDKKLKGIYCKDCALGVMTMEFQAISEADLRKPIRKSGSNSISVSNYSADSKPVQNTSRADVVGAARSPTPPHGKSSERIQSGHAGKATKNFEQRNAFTTTIIAGVVAAFFVTVLAIILATQSRSSRQDIASNEVNAPAPSFVRATAPVVTQNNSNLQLSPIKPPIESPVEAPQQPDPEVTAKADYDKMVKLVGSMDKGDSAGQLSAIDAFLTEHGASVLAQSARTLRDGITTVEQFNKTHALMNDLPDQQVHDPKQPAVEPLIAKAADSAAVTQGMLQQTLNLLSPMDIPAALRSVEQSQDGSADARNALKAALETLQKRDVAWRQAVARNVGHKVRMETKAGVVEGTVTAIEGDALKIDRPLVINGEVMGSATVVVAFADILPDAVAPLPVPATMDEWMGQALSSAAKRDFDAADTALAHCDGHTLQAALKSLESAGRTAARESKALALWKKAEGLFANKSLKLAKQDYETLQHEYAGTAALTNNTATIKERLEAIQWALGPRREISLDLGGGTKLDLVLIPAGDFEMGSNDGDSNEKPIHKVKISGPFYLGKYTVTQAQYEKVMAKNPSKFNGVNLPVEQVSYNDAEEFCKKVNTLTGKLFRLPTEAEWEYACRAGTKTKFNTGDNNAALEQAGWFDGNSEGKTHPVGGKKPNAFGLYDMHGNVWQWCQDWYAEDYYGNSVAENPQGPTQGSFRLLRGGSCSTLPVHCRSASRWDGPIARDHFIGFRVLMPVFRTP